LWTDYDFENGSVWVRLSVDGAASLAFGYGVCWNSPSTDDCFSRLSRAAFFNVPGRQTKLIHQGSSVTDFQKFVGPYGDWSTNVVTVSDENALLNQLYLDAGNGPKRVYSSAFYKYSAGKPSVLIFQSMANLCASADLTNAHWVTCQFSPWAGAQKKSPMTEKTAFPHHDMNSLFEYIGHSRNPSGLAELESLRVALQSLMQPYIAGIYANYPEFGFEQGDYGYLYWGQSLPRLANLRAHLDPNQLFGGVQQLPTGPLPCPGYLRVSTSSASTITANSTVQIVGYQMGQLVGMVASWKLSSGCTVVGITGASLRASGTIYTAQVNSPLPFTVTVRSGSANSCQFTTVSINGIAC
jgi:Berberine and berberine like